MHEAATELLVPRLPRAKARALSATARMIGALHLARAHAALNHLMQTQSDLEGPWVESFVEAPPDPSRVIAIVLEHRQHARCVALEFEEALALRIIDRVLGEERDLVAAGQSLSAVEQGVLAFGISRALSEVSDMWLLRDVTASQADVMTALATDAVVRATYNVRLRDYAPSQVLRIRLWMGADAEDVPPTGTAVDAPVDLRLVVGKAVLPVRAIDALELGDALVASALTLHPNGSGTLTIEPVLSALPRLTMQRTSDGLRIVGAPVNVQPQKQGKLTMTESSNALRDIPVEVVIEAGRLRLTLKELEQIAEGAVLETPIALPPKVQLVVGDKAIALGEIVDIEGELGVKITRVLSRVREGL